MHKDTRTPVADRVAAEIAALITRRALRPGQRLPSERALAAELGVSRASLREAITRLAAQGLVQTRKTGLVVARPEDGADDWAQAGIARPLAPLVAGQPGFGQDVIEIRQALEGSAAEAAARRAGPADLARIRAALDAMDRAQGSGTSADHARLDADFHLAIAAASQNAILHQVMSSLFGLLQASISASLEKLYLVPSTAEALAGQHAALFAAIAAGDGAAARLASDRHLGFVETTIRQIDEDLARQARASSLALSLSAGPSQETPTR